MSKNEITGDALISKIGDKKAYDEGYDRIFGKKDKPQVYSDSENLALQSLPAHSPTECK